MRSVLEGGGSYRTQVEILHPTLRMMMGLKEGNEAFHDVQMSLTKDPATLQPVIIVAQIDVTSAVLAKREVQQANAKLAEEKLRADALLYRQHELIECIGWVSDVGRSAAGNQRARELIDSVRKQIVSTGGSEGGIELGRLLGQGTVRTAKHLLWSYLYLNSCDIHSLTSVGSIPFNF